MRRGRVILLIGGVIVAGATVAYAAGFTLTSKRVTVLSTAAPTTTPSTSVPDNTMTIALANGSKTADLGDTVTITFNPSVKSDSFCSTWTGTATSFNLGTGNNDVVVTITNGTASANDTLSITGTASGACATGGFHLGTIDLGSAAYVNQAVDFKGSSGSKSSVVWTPGTKTMVITLGSPVGSASARGTVTTPITTTFTPDSNLRDTGNNSVTGSATTTSTF